MQKKTTNRFPAFNPLIPVSPPATDLFLRQQSIRGALKTEPKEDSRSPEASAPCEFPALPRLESQADLDHNLSASGFPTGCGKSRNCSDAKQERNTSMSIERAERLKRELTDKWVVVATGVPELKRFADLTGKVRTVNMNCRALVEFDNPVDISWYDIDPNFLTVVEAPKPKKSAGTHAEKPAAAPKPTTEAAKPAAAGGSPLDKIRAGGAGTTAAPKPAAGGSPLDKIRAAGAGAAPAAPAAGSPLDKIRAAGASGSAPKPEAPAPAPAPKPAAPTPAAGGSPLDRIRAQGAIKKSDS